MRQTQPSATLDRQARWVAMWRSAVRASQHAMGLADLSTTRFIELSGRAAELLRMTPHQHRLPLHRRAATPVGA